MSDRQENNDPQLEAIQQSLAEIDQIEELVWALLDEQITPVELEQLEQRLLTDDAARHRYVECIQMHADLHTHFKAQSQPTTEDQPATPINPLAGINLPMTGQGQTPAE